MGHIAILLSGHLRNFEEIIHNFYDNFIKQIMLNHSYDLYIHTWSNNFTHDKVINNDTLFKNINITKEYITELLNRKKISIKKIIIEEQQEVINNYEIKEYLNINTNGRSIHSNFNKKYIWDLTKKLFLQFYGHYKVLKCLDENQKYDYIVKTRPDMLYLPLDLNIFENDIFFPKSHQFNNTNINQLFFGGKTEFMLNILKFFEICIYDNKKMNFNIINKYHKSDINFNCLFRYYIIKYLKYEPFFIEYNPKLYRNSEHIITLV